ncbi:hypothetical protein [Sedimentibacter sp.]|uniref:hypothetical protein n=1 Tax=Sedimentibacter sp. TaxID=1960295 RepID=UPI0028A21CA3|nr:hypothetical protein [Sedimentibacter sp.]
MKSLLKQILSFLAVSGTGWLMDFCIFILLTTYFEFNVGYSNFISGIPALTFVFLVSTRKIFAKNAEGFSLKTKYVLYFTYQMVLIASISSFGQWLYILLCEQSIVLQFGLFPYLKIICKIIITPITMTINFIVMKLLSEKL